MLTEQSRIAKGNYTPMDIPFSSSDFEKIPSSRPSSLSTGKRGWLVFATRLRTGFTRSTGLKAIPSCSINGSIASPSG